MPQQAEVGAPVQLSICQEVRHRRRPVSQLLADHPHVLASCTAQANLPSLHHGDCDLQNVLTAMDLDRLTFSARDQ
mgnify:CR=1 FL=1